MLYYLRWNLAQGHRTVRRYSTSLPPRCCYAGYESMKSILPLCFCLPYILLHCKYVQLVLIINHYFVDVLYLSFLVLAYLRLFSFWLIPVSKALYTLPSRYSILTSTPLVQKGRKIWRSSYLRRFDSTPTLEFAILCILARMA